MHLTAAGFAPPLFNVALLGIFAFGPHGVENCFCTFRPREHNTFYIFAAHDNFDEEHAGGVRHPEKIPFSCIIFISFHVGLFML